MMDRSEILKVHCCGLGALVGQMPWIYWLNDYLTPYFGSTQHIGNCGKAWVNKEF